MKTSTSKNKCPFCSGRKWYAWRLKFDDIFYDCFNSPIPIIDMGFYPHPTCYIDVDECVECGAFALGQKP